MACPVTRAFHIRDLVPACEPSPFRGPEARGGPLKIEREAGLTGGLHAWPMPPPHEALRGYRGPPETCPGQQATCPTRWSPRFALLPAPLLEALGGQSLTESLIPPSLSPHIQSRSQHAESVAWPSFSPLSLWASVPICRSWGHTSRQSIPSSAAGLCVTLCRFKSATKGFNLLQGMTWGRISNPMSCK